MSYERNDNCRTAVAGEPQRSHKTSQHMVTQPRLQALEYCLISDENALAHYPASQSVQLVDCWLTAIAHEAAWELAHPVLTVPAQDKAEVVVDWLDSAAEQLMASNALSGKPLAARLRAARKQLHSMLDSTGSNLTVKQMHSKTQQQVYNRIIKAAAIKTPALDAELASKHSTTSSPFVADIQTQLSRSSAHPNQREAFHKLQEYFVGLHHSRPAAQELAEAMSNTCQAFCNLRSEVCQLMLTTLAQGSLTLSWPQCQAQLSTWLAEYAEAYDYEQQLLGEDSNWPNIPAGVVEPTGTGKTGIINLAPFAALGSSAPQDCSHKVLVVTPDLAIREGVFGSYNMQPGQNCLRDILNVISHPGMLPKAFDLSTLPCMAAAAAGDSDTAGSVSSNNKKAARDSSYSNNAAGGVVAAAAAIPLDADELFAYDDAMDLNNKHGEDLAALLNNAAYTSSSSGAQSGSSSAAAGTSAAPAIPVDSKLHQLALADVVVANIQQLPFHKLEILFPRDYFGVVLLDEGHHAAERTWGTVLDYFAPACKVLLTATPFRSDRSNLPMVVVMGQEDDLKISQRITQGLSSNVAYAPVPINSVEVAEAGSHTGHTYSGLDALHQLGERRDIQEAARKDLTVRECTMRYSLNLMQALRNSSGQRHTIIAQAHDTVDAELLCQQWAELIGKEYAGCYSVAYTHSKLEGKKQAAVKALAKSGQLDVCVHVGQLGEGFDAPALSVVVVFKVFRSMGPFMQLLGRAVRRIQAVPASHPSNVAYLVAHPLLGYHQHWQVYQEERQDAPRELHGRGSASNVCLVDCQAGDLRATSLPGPDKVFFLVQPDEILGGKLQGGATKVAASTVHVTAAAAHVVPGARAASAAQSAAAESAIASRTPRDLQRMAQHDLQVLSGEVSMQGLRSIIAKHPNLSNIKTSGSGRTKAAVQQDLVAALQAVVQGNSSSTSNASASAARLATPVVPGVARPKAVEPSTAVAVLTHVRQRLSAPGVTMKDLREVKKALQPSLDHIATSGAGRTTEAVKRDMLGAVAQFTEQHGTLHDQ